MNNIKNTSQEKLFEENDEFVESLNLTPEKIIEDLEKMRDIEGFPIGDVEDILELSNPPYYTAYPNPYIKDFIEYYGTPYDEETDEYNVKPFVGDISEGKNDKIYRAHTYHTKVPYKAIQQFIEHYTNKNDLIFDGFSGSGMTGLASLLSGRKAIISDLSPAATFISHNYNNCADMKLIDVEITNILKYTEKEWGWMFETTHSDGKQYKVNYMVWSDVLICPNCNDKFVYWDLAIDTDEGIEKKEFQCKNCDVYIKKNLCSKSLISGQVEQRPVFINYSVGNKRFTKEPDEYDLKLVKDIENIPIPFWFPTNVIPEGHNTNQPIKSHGFSNVSDFYYKRNLIILSAIYNNINKSHLKNQLLLFLTSVLNRNACKTNRFVIKKRSPKGEVNGPLSGTLYIPSVVVEQNVIDLISYKKKDVLVIFDYYKQNKSLISTQSSTDFANVPENSIDYIFTDPPFGANIMYSEMNFLWESWLKVSTNNLDEAIINEQQKKDEFEYSELIHKCFSQYYRILKPNRWITIEFHNSKASIWKIIQNSIIKSGFVIAQVAVLDKVQGTIHQDAKIKGSVKHDLVINAYKPSSDFQKDFSLKKGINLETDFISMHLRKLPIEQNIERTKQMLYSKLLAIYVQNGFEVKIDASEFYDILNNNFEEKDGFWFTKNQIHLFEKNIEISSKLDENYINQAILGIGDEKSAIIWLSQFLIDSKTYDEIFTEFSKKLMTSQDKIPELKIILDENFSIENEKYCLPSSIERKEKEKYREKRLSKEFNEILENAQNSNKKIKELRKEAFLFGLMELYEKKDVDKIKLLGERIDRNIIDSDDDISAIMDWAMYK